MKEDPKRKIEVMGFTQRHQQCRHSIESAYDFICAFHRNCAAILHLFRDIANYLLKVANYSYHARVLVPPLGVTAFEFNQDLWLQEKTSLCIVVRDWLRDKLVTEEFSDVTV